MANGNGKQSETVSQAEINGILWKACDTFRGTVDPSEYKNYILVMLFVKYISDVWQDHYETYQKQFGDDEARILRKLERERFVLPIVTLTETNEKTGVVTTLDTFPASQVLLKSLENNNMLHRTRSPSS